MIQNCLNCGGLFADAGERIAGDLCKCGNRSGVAVARLVEGNEAAVVLAKLVRLKDIKERYEALPQSWKFDDPVCNGVADEYERVYLPTKEVVWNEAREVLRRLIQRAPREVSREDTH